MRKQKAEGRRRKAEDGGRSSRQEQVKKEARNLIGSQFRRGVPAGDSNLQLTTDY